MADAFLCGLFLITSVLTQGSCLKYSEELDAPASAVNFTYFISFSCDLIAHYCESGATEALMIVTLFNSNNECYDVHGADTPESGKHPGWLVNRIKRVVLWAAVRRIDALGKVSPLIPFPFFCGSERLNGHGAVHKALATHLGLLEGVRMCQRTRDARHGRTVQNGP